MKHSFHNGGRYAAAPFCLLLVLAPAARLPAQQPTPLRFAAWRDQGVRPFGAVSDLLDTFHEAHPDVHVNLNYEDWSFARVRLRYWFGSHRQYAPHLTILPDTWLPAYADQLVPLDGVLRPKDTAGFVPALLDRCRVKGRLVGLPWLVRSRALYVRTDLLETAKVKPPRTLAELQAAAIALAKPPAVYGLGLPAAQGGGGLDTFLDLLDAHGGAPLDKDGKLQLQSKEAEAALGYWLGLQQAHALQPEGLTWTDDDLCDAFVAGHVAMLVAGPELGQRLRRAVPTLKFGVVPLPTDRAPDLPVSAEVLVALSNAGEPEAVGRFMRYMATAEAQRAMTFMGGLPTYQSHLERVRDEEDVAPFVAGMERARGLPMLEIEPAQRIIERALWLCLSGRSTPAEALKTASTEEAQRIF